MRCRLLILLLLAIGATAYSQSSTLAVEAGPLVRMPHYQQVIDFTKGGDGYYYVTTTASGSTQKFSAFGESVVTIMRFDQALHFVEKVGFGKGRGSERIKNVYGVLPHPDGIALLTVKRTEKGNMAWFLCFPDFDAPNTPCTCDSIYSLPGHSPLMTNPSFRFQQDERGNTAVAWRSLDQPQDNTLQVLVLGPDLRMLHPPTAPLLKWKQPIKLGPWALVDGRHLFIQMEGESKRLGRKETKGGGTGLLYHDFQGDSSELFTLSSSFAVPLTMSAARHPETQELILAGFWGEWLEDSLYLGLYKGSYSGGDTLATLSRWGLSDQAQKFLVYGDTEDRSNVHFRRPFQQGMEFSKEPGGQALQPLLWSSFKVGKNKKTPHSQHRLWVNHLGDHAHAGPLRGEYQNCVYGEFRNSWGFGLGHGNALVVDLSRLKNPVRPYGYRVLQYSAFVRSALQLEEQEVEQMISRKGKEFTLLQPRFLTCELNPVTVSRFRNNIRLVRMVGD